MSAASQEIAIVAYVRLPHIWSAHHPVDWILRPTQIGMAGPVEAWKTVFRVYVIGEKMTGRVMTAVLGRLVVTWLQRLV